MDILGPGNLGQIACPPPSPTCGFLSCASPRSLLINEANQTTLNCHPEESQSSRPRIGAFVRHKLWNNLVALLLGAVSDPLWFPGSIGQSRPTCELQASIGCWFSKVSDINDHGFSEERRATSAWSIKSEKGCVRRETLDCTGQA